MGWDGDGALVCNTPGRWGWACTNTRAGRGVGCRYYFNNYPQAVINGSEEVLNVFFVFFSSPPRCRRVETCPAQLTVPDFQKSRGSDALRGHRAHPTMSALHNPTNLPRAAAPLGLGGLREQQVIVPKSGQPFPRSTSPSADKPPGAESETREHHREGGFRHSQSMGNHLQGEIAAGGDTLQSPALLQEPVAESPSPLAAAPQVPDSSRAGCPPG